MDQINKIIKSLNFADEISSKLSMSDSILQITQAQQTWINDTNTISKALLKSISYNNNFLPKNIAGFNSMNLGSNLASLNISADIITSINNINKLQSNMFVDLKGLSKIGEMYQPYINQLKSMQIAMRSITAQIELISIQNSNWSLLEEFEHINEEAIEITNGFSSDFTLTDEETKRFEALIEKIIVFFKSNKKYGKNALLFISVILNVMALHQYYDFIKSKPAATKEDLIKFERRINQTIELKLREEKEYRTTNRISKVMLKPKNKTALLNTLPKGFDVIILQINHKWALVSYINPKDNLMETGWILKKYLNKVK
jgi:hypothetical protein